LIDSNKEFIGRIKTMQGVINLKLQNTNSPTPARESQNTSALKQEEVDPELKSK